ncbi:MAG: bifunctional 2-polyprenyl-6-hydroxyphenol methylase/3-demethylubiquinol 3-O-methyltransferase UbiG [Methylococcaceae bacterium]|nr:bifunctional 2-polyprenyl-6-hydroxyphenol methylase/3-demethylubiquinol 3-O-methyltransferase UbiG [Methylococcaceae bacterium]
MAPDPSIDPTEVTYYQAHGNLWWDPNGPFWLLHRLNALRVRFICDQLVSVWPPAADSTRPLSGLRILDLGCGGGILSEAISAMGASVTGVDIVSRNIDCARAHAEAIGSAVTYELASAEILAGRGDRFDAVLNMEVVEHVAELPIFLDACVRLVKPGGVMFVATINRTVASWLAAIAGAEYLLRWLPKGTHRWSKFPTDVELENLLEDRGMKVTVRTGVAVNPFTKTLSFTPYRGINYMLMAHKAAR